jgi:transcriptional regulator with XRE-family HTH domain
VDAGRILKTARRRVGLSQRELSARTGVPQPMISAIERGQQDPRHGTLDKLLRGCGQELDIVMRGGRGVDRSQFQASLRDGPDIRLSRNRQWALFLESWRHAQRVKPDGLPH